MLAMASALVVVKNTFIEVVGESSEHFRGLHATRRVASAPPAVRPAWRDKRANDIQLARLNAAFGRVPGCDAWRPPPEHRSPAGYEAVSAEACGQHAIPDGGGVARSDAVPAPCSTAPSLLSVGSRAHGSGACRPCIFARAPQGCRFGVDCGFCHVVTEHPEEVVIARPCKRSRERLRKMVSVLEARVEQDPGLLHGDRLVLPSSIESQPHVLVKVKQRLVKASKRGASAAVRDP